MILQCESKTYFYSKTMIQDQTKTEVSEIKEYYKLLN